MILVNFILIFYVLLYPCSGRSYFPIFEFVPPPLLYFVEGGDESSRVLTCRAWPPGSLTEITYYSTQRASEPRDQLSKAAPLHPLDKEHIQGSSVVVRNLLQARALSKLNLHCLAKTSFGAVISRPFRVVEARIGAFPSTTNVGEARKVVSYFMYGNVAYVDCIPPMSYPPAVIEFKLNDTTIQVSPRYKYIKRPNSQRVTLLIQDFVPRDQGYYRCIATNSITGEIKIDPLVQQLKIKSPVSNVPVSVKMTIFGRELPENGVSSNTMDVLTVREGVNVTLFCVMEGAPPPSVTTFKVRSSHSSLQRHISDKDFGFLSIINVSVDDEDSYLCSETGISDTAQLKVQKRLSIIQRPQDIKVNGLGSQARFTCLSNEANITPQWYFNGRIRTQTIQAGKDSSLYIEFVRKEDLGVYQCVARSKDEWVTEVASLSLKGDILMSKDDDVKNIRPEESSVVNSNRDIRRNRIKKNVDLTRINILSTSPIPKGLASPEVITINDNLAVLLKWQLEDGSNVMARHYKVEYKYQTANSKLWSTAQSFDSKITENYFYVTSRYLKAQHVYTFRVSAVFLNGISRYSQWSREVSFLHIYPKHPTIDYFSAYNSTHLKVQWQYADITNFPITCYKILVRKIIKDSSRVYYSKFWLFLVNNPDATETFVGPLSTGYGYQVVVYGIKESEPRKITQYSAEATCNIPAIEMSPVTMGPNKHNTDSNTRLMFVILGSLAGLMMLVIIVLVLMCYCRERKSVVMHRLNRYKDPAKLIHNSEQAKGVQSSFLLASISAAANANKQQSQPDSNAGEHASLLSAGPDAVYYQQKRQPPSGGSGHDMSDSEGVSVQEQSSMMTMQEQNGVQHHHNMHLNPSLNLTPQPPAITYYKASPGPASLPAGSLMRQGHQQHFSPQQRYSPGFQYGPQILYTNAGLVYSPGSYVGTMYPHQQQQQHMSGTTPRPDTSEMRSQDGGESVYSYFSQTSNNNPRQGGGVMQGTVEAGSQTMTSNGSAGHRHHRRKRRKINNSGNGVSDNGEMCTNLSQAGPRGVYMGGGGGHGQREAMYDTPPVSAASHQDPRMINVPPGMVLMQPGAIISPSEQCWAQMNNTLTRRGTPTLFVEPPRIRDFSEYGIPPHGQMAVVGQPQQLAHLSQQNLHLHNQNFGSGYRDAQA